MNIAYKKSRTKHSVDDAVVWVSKVAAEGLDTTSMSIPPGWSDLIVKLVKDIQRLDSSVRITRLHCWYGGLSVHVSHGDRDVYARLFWAEHNALYTCEMCGRRGNFVSLKERNSKTLCADDARVYLEYLGVPPTLPFDSRFRLFPSFRGVSAKKWI